jgi:dienelactone hydrolase
MGYAATLAGVARRRPDGPPPPTRAGGRVASALRADEACYPAAVPKPMDRGDLATYSRARFARAEYAYDVYRKGQGPAVIILAEMPGISPQVLGFADRVVALGCTAVLPHLFGTPGRDPLVRDLSTSLYAASTLARACVSREFTTFATGRSSPVVSYLRALARHEHERCGGPGVGVVGMCFTGGFGLAMAVEPCVLAPVLSQPSMPIGPTADHRRGIDCSREDLQRVKQRCATDGLQVVGLRFHGDPLVPAERFDFLRDTLGEAFVAVELDQADGHPDSPLPRHHSVLTASLIDEPGARTRDALDRVLDLFRTRLLLDADLAS